MRLPHLVLAGALVASVAAAPSTLAAATAPSPSAAVSSAAPERYVVAFAGDALPTGLAARLRALGVSSAVAFESINALALTAPRSVVDALVGDGGVLSVRPERQLQLHLSDSVPYIGADRETLGTPAAVQVPADGPGKGKGKDKAKGRPEATRTVVRPAVDGTGTTVAVLDTGITDAHPDLSDRVVAHRNFELSYAADLLLTGEQLDTYALATGDSARTDDIGHGTHVAGIVAGTGFAAQNRPNDNKGVAPGAQLVDLRIAGGPVNGFVGDTGWERNALAAFDWLSRHHEETSFGANGIGLSTNSWGLLPEDTIYGSPSYDPLREMLELLDGEGLTTVFSAGNDGRDDDVTNATIPNGVPEVISVAASCHPRAATQECDAEPTANDIGKFSSRGPAVDIAAPGVEIVSAVGPNAVGAIGKGCAPKELAPFPCVLTPGSYGGESPTDAVANYAMYGSLNGTSMAAPHIAGVVALLLQANPDLTPEQVQVVLAATAADRQAAGRDIDAGYGIVDVPSALVAVTRLAQGESLAQVFPGFAWSPSM